ncbi:MAG: protease modulator HflC [Candidatus Omnitrophica bacterium]|nr:protease modulator HflC [Candidatus Omnitrophota bacterium]
MRGVTIAIGIIALLWVFLLASGLFYIVDETQQVVVTQFGKPVGEPIKEAGLKMKMPFIQKANYFDKRLLEWDGDPNQIPTKDKKYIYVDTTARWKIVDPLKFLRTVHNEIGAQARLDDIIDSATRDYVTSHNLIEVVRSSNRMLTKLEDIEGMGQEEQMEEILVGREQLVKMIFDQASQFVPEYGIQLIDVRIKRIRYVEEVQQKVFDRMISERKRAAEEYRSEGMGKSAEIEGLTVKELKKIQSEAYKKAEEIKGQADAEATTIYAEAYGKDPDFYQFLRTLEAYQKSLGKKTRMILTTDSDYFRYLKEKGGEE